MVQERRIFAFRWLLPTAQLSLCIVVLWPFRTVLVQQVRTSVHAYRAKSSPQATLPENQHILVVPLNAQQQPKFEKEEATFERLEKREWIPQALNLPSGLVQLPYVILNPTKREWIPRDMSFRTWRVLSWPLVGILFWWIAGRGVEGLVAARQQLIRPRITWIETIAGAALCAFCGAAAVCIPRLSVRVGSFPMRLFVCAFGMWAVLGGVVVAARVTQWRLRHRPHLDVGHAPAGPSS